MTETLKWVKYTTTTGPLMDAVPQYTAG